MLGCYRNDERQQHYDLYTRTGMSLTAKSHRCNGPSCIKANKPTNQQTRTLSHNAHTHSHTHAYLIEQSWRALFHSVEVKLK